MKKLIIYDSQSRPANEYQLPKFVDKSLENKWAVMVFTKFRKAAKDKSRIDHWAIKTDEEE